MQHTGSVEWSPRFVEIVKKIPNYRRRRRTLRNPACAEIVEGTWTIAIGRGERVMEFWWNNGGSNGGRRIMKELEPRYSQPRHVCFSFVTNDISFWLWFLLDIKFESEWNLKCSLNLYEKSKLPFNALSILSIYLFICSYFSLE